MLVRKMLALALLTAGVAACGAPTAEPEGDAMTAPDTGAPVEQATAPAVDGPAPEEPFEEGGNIQVPAAMVAEALDGGTPIVFVDARPALDYESGHIPGAVHVPFHDAEANIGKVPQDQWAIVYCECPTAEAQQVADVLMANGYTKVKIIEEGLAGWRDLGRELEKGPPES